MQTKHISEVIFVAVLLYFRGSRIAEKEYRFSFRINLHSIAGADADNFFARMNPGGGGANNKHKQLLGIVPGMGGGQMLFMCCVFLGEKGKHINKIPRESQERPGQSRDNPGTIP